MNVHTAMMNIFNTTGDARTSEGQIEVAKQPNILTPGGKLLMQERGYGRAVANGAVAVGQTPSFIRSVTKTLVYTGVLGDLSS
jgi:hypothetical protein